MYSVLELKKKPEGVGKGQRSKKTYAHQKKHTKETHSHDKRRTKETYVNKKRPTKGTYIKWDPFVSKET